jgi:16S rRNA (cytosine1402-N4)-methyltransferase
LNANPAPHIPVLLNEVIDALQPRDGGTYVDATFGAGGYSRAILRAAKCSVWGIDRDPDAQIHCDTLAKEFPDRIALLQGRFGDMEQLLATVGADHIDGIAIDLGVSSMQLDDAARGFSFRYDGPLDMRMEQSGLSAADVVNTMDEDQLANIIYQFGEERASRKVARIIVEQRVEEPFTRTAQLAGAIRKVVRKSKDGIDPATRTFQALRIYVNDELGEVERGLQAAEKVLSPGGRLAVVSFHSLEDRLIKRFMRDHSGGEARGSRHMPQIPTTDVAAPAFRQIKRSGIAPSDAETRSNPRSRSSRLRWAERTDNPASSTPIIKGSTA